jgi:hypothetical protein
MGEEPRRAAPRSALVLALAACLLVLAVGFWLKVRCLPGGWQGGQEYLGWCYTDLYALYFDAQLHDAAVPYLDHPLEYPVLTGAWMWATAGIARRLAADAGTAAVAFTALTALAGAALTLLTVGLLWRLDPGRERLLWFAASPLLAVHVFTNWEPLPVLLLVAAVAAHRRDADVLAGILAGLGVAAKLFPGLLIPLVVAARWAQGRRGDAMRHLAAAAGIWLVVNAPVAALAPDGWLRFFTLNRERPANFETLWFLLEHLRGAPFEPSTVNALASLALLLGAAVIVAVGMRGRPPARWWELALPLLAWFLVTNKVYSPQYTLWLLPLLVLALPRRDAFVAFTVADLAVFAVLFPFLGGVLGYSPAPGYPVLAAVAVLRLAVLCWIVVESTRSSAVGVLVPAIPAGAATAARPADGGLGRGAG